MISLRREISQGLPEGKRHVPWKSKKHSGIQGYQSVESFLSQFEIISSYAGIIQIRFKDSRERLSSQPADLPALRFSCILTILWEKTIVNHGFRRFEYLKKE